MAEYFKYFPRDFYQLSNNSTSLEVVTNITSRVSLDSSLKDNASSYYEYVLQEGDTPENLSFKFYGKSTNHWIILMMNDIVNPQFDWPLDDSSLKNFINKKYNEIADTANTSLSGLEWSKQNIKSYFKIIERRNVSSRYVTRETIEIDANSYANISNTVTDVTLQDGSSVVLIEDKGYVSYFDYELNLNEVKRTIRILKPEYVPLVEKELEGIFQ
jgi:hypothetical protein